MDSWLIVLYTILWIGNAIADDESQQGIDTFYDETTSANWVILAGEVLDDFASKWEENEHWDSINENVETQKGHFVTRKCENIFGNSLCLCRFEKLEKIHNCHRNSAKEAKKQQYLRNAYAMHHTHKNAANMDISTAHSGIQNNVNGMISSVQSKMRTHPLFQRFWGNQRDRQKVQSAAAVIPETKTEKLFALKEEKIEDEIAAAQIEADNNELDDDEIDAIEDEVDELIEEEDDYEEGKEIEEDILDDDELINDDDDIDMDDDINDDETETEIAESEEYDDEIIDVLDNEVDTQTELIEKQNELIDELKKDNAAKEELIEVLEENEESDIDDDMDDMDDEQDIDDDIDDMDEDVDNDELDNDVDSDMDNDEFEDKLDNDMDNGIGNDEVYDDDNADEEEDEDVGEIDDDEIDDDVEDVDNANEGYYDNVEDDNGLAQEDYNELYDVDGENEDNKDEFKEGGDTQQEENQQDLEAKEKKAMIADTFWGLEIYSIAFMVLCCCCVSCYMKKTKCCGYCKKDEKTFAYSAYHNQGGFKRVFGNVDDDNYNQNDYEQDDVEMGVDQNDSDEAQALHS